jgi:hypothetical protein
VIGEMYADRRTAVGVEPGARPVGDHRVALKARR